jgi:hypothetical protein
VRLEVLPEPRHRRLLHRRIAAGIAGLEADRRGRREPEKLDFEAAVAAEAARLGDAHQRLADGTLERSFAHQHFSYLARGHYAEQLESWFSVYPREQFLVLRFEDLAREPLATLNTTLGFLGLPPAAAVDLEARNTRRYPPMADAVAAQLRDYFEPFNRRLEALLGWPTGW